MARAKREQKPDPDAYVPGESAAKPTGPITLGPRVCAHCGRNMEIMIAMAPGHDNQVWYLCMRDWKDGLPDKKKAAA